jgi:tetratricopeptide (TPR) repeat protein
MGYAYDGLADYGQAIAHYEQAVDIYRDIGDAEDQSGSLIRLGDVQLAAGLPARARLSWEQALAVLTRIPGVDTGEVRGRLAQLAAVNGTGFGAVLPA